MKLEDMEDDIAVVKDFVLEHVRDFDERLETIERMLNESSKEESTERELVAQLTSTPKMRFPTPMMLGLGAPSGFVPTTIEEVPDVNLREGLQQYMPDKLDPKELMNKVQVAFFRHWVANNSQQGWFRS